MIGIFGEFPAYFVDTLFEECDFGGVCEFVSDGGEFFDGFLEEAFLDALVDLKGGGGTFFFLIKFGFEDIFCIDGVDVCLVFEFEVVEFGGILEVDTDDDTDDGDDGQESEGDEEEEAVS